MTDSVQVIRVSKRGVLAAGIIASDDQDGEFVVKVQKRPVPDSLCDTRDHNGCGGPLYRWTRKTTLDYWPVIRCENHLRLQRLWGQYLDEWWAQHEWYTREESLSFEDWLKENWSKDTSAVDYDFKYWELVTAGNGD